MKQSKRLNHGEFIAVLDSLESEEIVHVFGPLDISNATEFEEFVKAAYVLGKRTVIDLCECPYIDSSFLRVVLSAWKLLGGRLQLRVTRDTIPHRVLTIAGIDRFLSVVARPAPNAQHGAPHGLTLVDGNASSL